MKKIWLLLVLILIPVYGFTSQTPKVPQEILTFLHNNPTANKISAADLLKKMASDEKITLIDVRTPREFAVMHPTGAINIPYDQLAERLDEIPHDGLVVAICHSGRRAEGATTVLRILGFDNVVNLSGGIMALTPAITSKSAPPLIKDHKPAEPINPGPAEDDEDAEPDMGC